MIYKRHLWAFGAKCGAPSNVNDIRSEKEKLGMGEDEEKEAMPQDLIVLRTWWRKRQNIN